MEPVEEAGSSQGSAGSTHACTLLQARGAQDNVAASICTAWLGKSHQGSEGSYSCTALYGDWSDRDAGVAAPAGVKGPGIPGVGCSPGLQRPGERGSDSPVHLT